jgi:uncharacterized membrane protein
MEAKSKFAFERINYIIMLIGLGILFLGLFIMTLDKETYGFGFLGLTLGPVVVTLGFLTQFVAIFYKKKKSEDLQENK